jgi:N6-adenosine-specific RNA methylase IME4
MGVEIPPLLRGLRRNYYPVIAADVPWDFVVWSKKNAGQPGDRAPKYNTMSLAQIAALPVARYAAQDSRLLFWVTGPFLSKGAHIPIMRGWGFEPSAIFNVWLKPTQGAWDQGALFVDHEKLWKMGMGHTSRQNCEYVVEGRRGSPPKRLAMDIRQEIVEPIREHSRKPEKFYQNAERYAAGPYLELFGRQQRKGWTVRGDEANKFGRAKK